MAAKNEGISKVDSKRKPLFLYYDCEAANSNIYSGDIIEIAARCHPGIRNSKFESFISTSQELAKFTVERCCIKPEDLNGKENFPNVFNKFTRWIQNLLKRINQKSENNYFPVLCAHGGYTFDFPMLLSNMKRHNVDQNVLKKCNMHFADTFEFCKELQADGLEELCETRLSMDSLFLKFCPGKQFLNRHRAMGDVNAMVEIFTTEPLKNAINNIDIVTTQSLFSWYETQYSAKEQKILLEEKMSKLDAYTKTVNLKKLVQSEINYDGIQRIFEHCCSFMDFYEAMKDVGIDRKTAKYFACQFGGLGLKNQGSVPYCNNDVAIDDCELDFSLHNLDELLPSEKEKVAVNVHPLPHSEFVIRESSESWESELDDSRSFSMTVTKPVAQLSLTIDDFVSKKTTSYSMASRKKSTLQNEHIKKHLVTKKSLIAAGNSGEPGKTSSKKEDNVVDAFRNGTASLQVCDFPDKKQRYELEKELVAQITKVRVQIEDNNSEIEKIPGKIEERENGDVLRKKDVKDVSRNSKDKIPGKRDEVPVKSAQGITKQNVEDVSYEEMLETESSSPTANLNVSSNEGNTTYKDRTIHKKPPRKYIGKTWIGSKGRNKKQFEKQQHKESSSAQGKTPVTIIKRNTTSQNNDLAQKSEDSISSAEKTDRDAVSLQQHTSIERAKPLQENPNATNGPSTDKDCETAKKDLKNSMEQIQDKSFTSNDIDSGSISKQETLQQVGNVTGLEMEIVPLKVVVALANKGFRQDQRGPRGAGGGDDQDQRESRGTGGGDHQDRRGTGGEYTRRTHKHKSHGGTKRGKMASRLLEKSKGGYEPVVFINTSRDEIMKDWPRVEIFIGDIPIYIPVDPLNDDKTSEENHCLEKKSYVCDKPSEGIEGIIFGDFDLTQTNVGGNNQIQDSVYNDDRCCRNATIDVQENSIVERQHGERAVDDIGTVSAEEKKDSNVQLIHLKNSVESPDEAKNTPSPETCDVTDSILVSADVIDTKYRVSSVYTCTEVESVQLNEVNDHNLLRDVNHNNIPEMIDVSQQTNLSHIQCYNPEQKKLVSHEQQTDCALYSTFNVKPNDKISDFKDKETLTDSLMSCPQSGDSLSSYGGNISDSHDTFYSLYESSTPPRSPDSQHHMCLDDNNHPYYINAEVNKTDDNEYESPGTLFNLSIRSPHHEDIYPGEDTRYSESIPSPEYVNDFSYRRKFSHGNAYSQTLHGRLLEPNFYLNSSSNSSVLSPRCFNPHYSQMLPFYPGNHVQARHVFPARFPPRYLQRNSSNVLPNQYHGQLNF